MIVAVRGSIPPLAFLVVVLAGCVAGPEDDDDSALPRDDDDSALPRDDDDSTEPFTPSADCGAESFDWGRGGGLMLPGTDCLSCHRDGGHAQTVFSVGGTVSASKFCPEPQPDAIVHIEDAEGLQLELPVNEAGNFWSLEPLVWPFTVGVELDDELTVKQVEVPTLACNSCHRMDAEFGLIAVGAP